MATSGPKQTLFFITPVFERYEIAAICLKQRRHACDLLEKEGINATCVVVGDDDNLLVAADLGFPTVTRDNRYLGRKFNDGHEYAAKHGATHVAPVGSDSWMDPTWLIDRLPRSRAILSSRHYMIVHRTGMKRAEFYIPLYVSYVIPIKLLAHCNYRPVLEERMKGCDTDTMANIDMGGKGPVRRIYSDKSHRFDTVAFQSPVQITDYDRIYGRWGIGETYDAFEGLRDHYPSELVDEIENVYDINNEAASFDLLERVQPYLKKLKRADATKMLFEIEACLIRRERDLARNTVENS